MQLWNMAWCFVYNRQADVYFIERIDWHLAWFFERQCICALWNPHIYDNLKNYIVLSLYLDIICKEILSIWSRKEPFHIIFLTCIGSKWITIYKIYYKNSNILSNAVFSHRFSVIAVSRVRIGRIGHKCGFLIFQVHILKHWKQREYIKETKLAVLLNIQITWILTLPTTTKFHSSCASCIY